MNFPSHHLDIVKTKGKKITEMVQMRIIMAMETI